MYFLYYFMIDGQIRDDPDRTVAMNHIDVTTDEPKEQLSSVAVTAPKALHQRQLNVVENTVQSSPQSLLQLPSTILDTVGALTAAEEVLLQPSSASNTLPLLLLPPLGSQQPPTSPARVTSSVAQQPILSATQPDAQSANLHQQPSSPGMILLHQQQQNVILEDTTAIGAEVVLHQQWDNVDMCKSNVLPFNFETSLLRDESKLSIIFKSLPEYANVKADIEIEYQGESVEGIFSTDNYQHVRGQQISDINQFRQMRGLVYHVRELFTSGEDEQERGFPIILCWADDTASTSKIFLERVSFDEYIRLMEDG